jgi:hypothetical protein
MTAVPAKLEAVQEHLPADPLRFLHPDTKTKLRIMTLQIRALRLADSAVLPVVTVD